MRLSRFASFRFGLLLPLHAARLIIRHPVLFFWSAIPLAITTGLYFWVIGSLQSAAKQGLLNTILAWGWDPNGFWAGVLVTLTQITLFLAGAMTFSIAASLIASPFNDLLAEQVESRATPPLPPPPAAPPGLVWRMKLRLVWIDIAKSVAAGIATVLALLLSWVPILNVAAFVLTFLLMCFQYTSYPQTRRGVGLASGGAFLFRYFYASCGFGAGLAVLYTLPLISIFALPLAVVGGTLLVARAAADDLR